MFEDSEEQSGIRLPTRRAERRTDQRVSLDVPVLVDSLRRWETCQARDVSAGGFSILSESDWSGTKVVDVYFELPNRGMVETRAQIVAQSPGRAHLRFLALSPSARAALASYVKVRCSPVIPAAGGRPRVRPVLPRRS
jgi:hypothetical protein